MLTIRPSMQKSLRWLRRTMVVILIVSNFVTVILADAASALPVSRSSSPSAAAFYAPRFLETAGIQPVHP